MRIEIERWAALLFDLDGTLVDSMGAHYRAYRDVLAARGHQLTEADWRAVVGAPARVAIPRFLQAAGAPPASGEEVAAIHQEKQAAFGRALHAAPLPALPAADLLAAAAGRVPCALVTSGNRAGAAAILAAMNWADRFAAVVTGDDVAHGKPDPEPFLRAAELLGVSPARCLVLEDTEVGLAAARAAGMAAVDVTAGLDWR